jgi:predicted NBD/HSP70 family sugar kinase
MMNDMKTRGTPTLAGIDIGGTKIRWALLYKSSASQPLRAQHAHNNAFPWRIASSLEIPTPRSRRAFMAALHTIIVSARARGATSVGIGIAGTLSRGKILRSPHLPFLEGLDLVRALRRDFPDIAIVLENDARCAALAEASYRASMGAKNARRDKSVLMVTVGTGVGRAVLKGNTILSPVSLENAESWEPAYRRLAKKACPSAAALAKFLGPRLAALAASHDATTVILGGGRLRTKGLFPLMRVECRRAGFPGILRRSHFHQNEGAIGAALFPFVRRPKRHFPQ